MTTRTLSSWTPLLAAALLGCAGGSEAVSGLDPAALSDSLPGTPIDATGGFGCDFQLDPSTPPDAVPAAIERDRMYMAAQPGIIHKHLPLAIDTSTGALYSGGRYLFDTVQDAAAYQQFVTHDFVLDGVQFLDRTLFLDPVCNDWIVVGARDFAPIDHQVVFRTERWDTPKHAVQTQLSEAWPTVVEEAASRGYTSVTLEYNPDLQKAQLVYYADRVAPPDPQQPDFASLGALAGDPPLGDVLDVPKTWTRSFDRTEWTFTVWFPYEPGDSGTASLWPNSPPLPAPYCGDTVCEPSRGETSTSCAADCAPSCGDQVCDPDETSHSCPSDCREGY